MGCNDYDDPIREKEDLSWRRNTNRLRELNFQRLPDPMVQSCNTCGALVHVGNLRREESVIRAEKHHTWHQEQQALSALLTSLRSQL